jgi:thioredoxin 1
MRLLTILFALAIIATTACKKTDSNPQSKVIQDIRSLGLYQEKIANGVSFMFFHASWCTRCKAVRPAIEAASQDSRMQPVFFAEVNYEINPEIVNQYQVDGFPTMIIYKNGVEVDRLTGTNHTTESLVQRVLPHVQ